MANIPLYQPIPPLPFDVMPRQRDIGAEVLGQVVGIGAEVLGLMMNGYHIGEGAVRGALAVIPGVQLDHRPSQPEILQIES